MGQYHYKSRDNAGELHTGTIEADSIEHAGLLLREQGRYVVKLTAAARAALASQDKPRKAKGKKIPRRLVITFAHQMAVMIDTGVPISEALECITQQTDHEDFQAVLEQVHDHVTAGGEFSAALAAHQKVFPEIMVSLVRAAEVSGTLGQMLETISQYMTNEARTAKKVKGALTYPAVMLTMVLAVTVFLIAFVLPKFTEIYANRGAALPGPTKLLMGISEAVQTWWMYGVGGIVATGVALWLFLRTDSGQHTLDRTKLTVPLVGPLFNKLYLTRSCRTMAAMLAAGVPILEMVSIVRRVTGNRYFSTLWDEMDDVLQDGGQLSQAMFDSEFVPRSVAQMIFAGEKAGRLSPVMDKIAGFTEEELDAQIKQATQFIEPAMVVIMGTIVGFVAISLLLPIFSVGNAVAG